MLNKVLLIGRTGKDPEIKNVGEHKVASFSLATSRKIKGEETTQWHDCRAWNKLAEIMEQYVKKGDPLYVEGEIQYRKHEDKYYTNINVNQLTMLGGKGEKPQEGTPSTNQNEEADALPF